MKRVPTTFARDVFKLRSWAKEFSLGRGTALLNVIRRLSNKTSPNVKRDVRILRAEVRTEPYYKGLILSRAITRIGKYSRGKNPYETVTQKC